MSEEPTFRDGRNTTRPRGMLRARHRLKILDVSELSRFMAKEMDEQQSSNSPTLA